MGAVITQSEIESLENIYQINEHEEVLSFIRANPFLVPLLQEAPDYIQKYFPQTILSLQLVTDPEIPNDTRLWLNIGTKLDVDEAMNKEEELDQDWWWGNMERAENKFQLDLEFL